MSYLLKAFTFTIVFNIFLTLLVVFGFAPTTLGDSDILTRFISIDNTNQKINPSGNYTGTMPVDLTGGTIGAGATGFSFIDALKMVWSFLLFVLLSLFAPIYWGYLVGFPLWLQFFMFLPQLITIFGIIYLIRGDGN